MICMVQFKKTLPGVWMESPQGEAFEGVADDGGDRHGHAAVEVDGLAGSSIGGGVVVIAGLGDVGEDVEHVDHADVVLADGAGGRVGLEDHGPAGADPVPRRRGDCDSGDAGGEERVRRVRERRRVGTSTSRRLARASSTTFRSRSTPQSPARARFASLLSPATASSLSPAAWPRSSASSAAGVLSCCAIADLVLSFVWKILVVMNLCPGIERGYEFAL